MKVKVEVRNAYIDLGIDKKFVKLLFPRGFFTLLVNELLEDYVSEIEKKSSSKLEILERLYTSVYGDKSNWSGTVWDAFESARMILTQFGEVRLFDTSKNSFPADSYPAAEIQKSEEGKKLVEVKKEVQKQEPVQEVQKIREQKSKQTEKAQEQKLGIEYNELEASVGEAFSERVSEQQKKVDTQKVKEFLMELENKFAPRVKKRE